jgi:hypothetical protein
MNEREQARDDVFRIAALLAELDRILHPFAPTESGEFNTEPTLPPVLPPVSPAGGEESGRSRAAPARAQRARTVGSALASPPAGKATRVASSLPDTASSPASNARRRGPSRLHGETPGEPSPSVDGRAASGPAVGRQPVVVESKREALRPPPPRAPSGRVPPAPPGTTLATGQVAAAPAVLPRRPSSPAAPAVANAEPAPAEQSAGAEARVGRAPRLSRSLPALGRRRLARPRHARSLPSVERSSSPLASPRSGAAPRAVVSAAQVPAAHSPRDVRQASSEPALADRTARRFARSPRDVWQASSERALADRSPPPFARSPLPAAPRASVPRAETVGEREAAPFSMSAARTLPHAAPRAPAHRRALPVPPELPRRRERQREPSARIAGAVSTGEPRAAELPWAHEETLQPAQDEAPAEHHIMIFGRRRMVDAAELRRAEERMRRRFCDRGRWRRV